MLEADVFVRRRGRKKNGEESEREQEIERGGWGREGGRKKDERGGGREGGRKRERERALHVAIETTSGP